MKPFLTFAAAVMFAVLSAACGTQSSVNNSNGSMAMNHDHGNMPNGTNANSMHGIGGHSPMQSSTNAASAPYDLQFIDTMTAHHQAAVDMAALAAKRAGHGEIKSLAADIMLSQQKEIVDMKAWRDKWFAGAPPALNMEMAGMHGSMETMDMTALGSLSGTEFDLAFIKQMIPHHEGAVAMAREAQKKATRSEIKMLAETIIKAQETEINRMSKWQTAWQK